MLTEDFMALTLDVWPIPPESATRVGHPAPFPVELPEQLIRLYTFVDDLVLDPFMGSGSALVAAARLGRRYVGYDLDPEYVEIARQRVHDAHAVMQQHADVSPRHDGTSVATSAPEVARHHRGQGSTEAGRAGAHRCRVHDRAPQPPHPHAPVSR